MSNKPEQWSAAAPEQWSDMVEAQQRWWTEWLEASQLWMSWWYSTLPPMPWPPAGVVLPAPETPATPTEDAKPTTPPSRAAAAPPTGSGPQRKPRAASARHH